ncbi:hypothetical protein FNF31_04702 [Cafeteria roenbergensis]|uniref:Uncharacterized protein n=1 Tax=Cafeteria roenbergensis TaxID=33653 RepID=A0A5A8D2S8_CAFRO|nr:hypothetical protein FNF31_04702 [Cafeteria roenbergensis]
MLVTTAVEALVEAAEPGCDEKRRAELAATAQDAAELGAAHGEAVRGMGWSSPPLLAVASALSRGASVAIAEPGASGKDIAVPLAELLAAAGEHATPEGLRDEAGRALASDVELLCRSGKAEAAARLASLAAAAAGASPGAALKALAVAARAKDRMEGAHGALVAEAVARRAALLPATTGLPAQQLGRLEAALVEAGAAHGSVCGGAPLLAGAGATLHHRARAAAAQAATAAVPPPAWCEDAAGLGWRLLARAAVALGRWQAGSFVSFESVHFHGAEAALAMLRGVLLAEAEAAALAASEAHKGRAGAREAARGQVHAAAESLAAALGAVLPAEAAAHAPAMAAEVLLWAAATPAPLRPVGVLDARPEAQEAGESVEAAMASLGTDVGAAGLPLDAGSAAPEPGVPADAALSQAALDALLPTGLIARPAAAAAAADRAAAPSGATKRARKRQRELARRRADTAAAGVTDAALAELLGEWQQRGGAAAPLSAGSLASLAKRARAGEDAAGARAWALSPWDALHTTALRAGVGEELADRARSAAAASWQSWGPGRVPARVLLQAARAAHDANDVATAASILETARLSARAIMAAGARAQPATSAAPAGSTPPDAPPSNQDAAARQRTEAGPAPGAGLAGAVRSAEEEAGDSAPTNAEGIPQARVFGGQDFAEAELESAEPWAFAAPPVPASSQSPEGRARPALPPLQPALDDVRDAAARAALCVVRSMSSAEALKALLPTLAVPSLAGPAFTSVHDALVMQALDEHDPAAARNALTLLARRGRHVSHTVVERLCQAAADARIAESLSAAEALGRSSLLLTGYQPWHVPTVPQLRSGFLRALAQLPAAAPADAARMLAALPTGIVTRAVRGRFLPDLDEHDPDSHLVGGADSLADGAAAGASLMPSAGEAHPASERPSAGRHHGRAGHQLPPQLQPRNAASSESELEVDMAADRPPSRQSALVRATSTPARAGAGSDALATRDDLSVAAVPITSLEQAQAIYATALADAAAPAAKRHVAGELASSLGLSPPSTVADDAYGSGVAAGKDALTAEAADALNRSRQRYALQLAKLQRARGLAGPGGDAQGAGQGTAAAADMPPDALDGSLDALADAALGAHTPSGPAEVVPPPMPRDPPSSLMVVRSSAAPPGSADAATAAAAGQPTVMSASRWALLAGVASRIVAEPRIPLTAWRAHSGLVAAWEAARAAVAEEEERAMAEERREDAGAAAGRADALDGAWAASLLEDESEAEGGRAAAGGFDLGAEGGDRSAGPVASDAASSRGNRSGLSGRSVAGSGSGSGRAGGWLAVLDSPPPMAPLLSADEGSRLRRALQARADGAGEGGSLREAFELSDRLQAAGFEVGPEDAERLVKVCCRADQPRRAEQTAQWAEGVLGGAALTWRTHAALARAWAGAGALAKAERRCAAMLQALPEHVAAAGRESGAAVVQAIDESRMVAGARAEARAKALAERADGERREREAFAQARLGAGSRMKQIALGAGAGAAAAGDEAAAAAGGVRTPPGHVAWSTGVGAIRAGAASALHGLGLPDSSAGAAAGVGDDDDDAEPELVVSRRGATWRETAALHEAEETVALVVEAAASTGQPRRATAVVDMAARYGVLCRVLSGAPLGVIDVTPLRDESAGCVLFAAMDRLRARAREGKPVPDTLVVPAAASSLVHVKAVLEGLSPALRCTVRHPPVQHGAGGVALPCVPRVEVSAEDLTAWLTAPRDELDAFSAAPARGRSRGGGAGGPAPKADPWEAEADDWNEAGDAAEAARQREEFQSWHQRWALRRAEARLAEEEQALATSSSSTAQLRRQLRWRKVEEPSAQQSVREDDSDRA